ncbi:hypothetical protein CDO87_11760 [Sagittula sp. P11]|jgi:hypothetical protein|uniref:hypothetical protein n=1 Tax=unclassified Sagittula TaxID=2624628 RepID=UPI000C2D1BAA|nr:MULTISPECIES: hypothetical protein [unclassified Sagittula]AUC53813.1 hypothetical protein CDO87_11760 [Sagittula sp. P11]WHZ34798.1 hypothetical protein QNI11_19460 [Sagittula sp. MA-2]
MSNIAGKAYAMNVVTPSHPRITWVNRLLFMAARGLPENLAGLLGLSLIHFARWVIIRRKDWPDLGQGEQHQLDNDYVLFLSNFNGTWDQYIDAFSDGIPKGLDLFWYSATKYPLSIPITPFKTYITHNQIFTDHYYNATPGSAQRDIKSALKVYDAVLTLDKAHADQSPEAFAESWRAAMTKVQGNLGEPGFGPVASLDTERADQNREAYVRKAQATFDLRRARN